MAGRPRKYKTDQQRKLARKASKKRTEAPSVKSRYFRLVIPNLIQYSLSQNVSQLDRLKGDVLLLLQEKQSFLEYYSIAIQTHPTTGIPHFDILLLYQKSVLKSLNRFDYLIKHGNLTPYRRLNQAILQYGLKQDKFPLSNLPSNLSNLLDIQSLTQNPYLFLRDKMLQDPFSFDAHVWLSTNKLDGEMSKLNWPRVLSFLKKQQQAECYNRLHKLPGLKELTRSFIQQTFTSQQLALYDSWPGYQVIVDKLNEMIKYGSFRPFRSTNLYVCGATLTGKTMLVQHLRKLIPIYSFGLARWFPRYKDGVYSLMSWQEFKLSTFPYNDLLQHLDGSSIQLQWKGGSIVKRDNPLVYMTSNLTLDQHLIHRFGKNPAFLETARQNLPPRLVQVIIPEGYTLDLLFKLLVPA